MPITIQELAALEARINAKLAKYDTKFVLTAHFSGDRVNHLRNVPPITIAEIESILDRLVARHINAILGLSDQSTFNVRCGNSHINMPCGFAKTTSTWSKTTMYEVSVITVMRKQNFRAKDRTEFVV